MVEYINLWARSRDRNNPFGNHPTGCDPYRMHLGKVCVYLTGLMPVCTKWSLRVWDSRWGTVPWGVTIHVRSTLNPNPFRRSSDYKDPWLGSASRRRRGREKGIPWFGFRLVIGLSCWSQTTCVHIVWEIVNSKSYPFPWTWVRIWLEPCRASGPIR